MSHSSPRLAAATAVAAVASGRNLDEALLAETARLSPADAALTRAIAFGTVRERRLLETLAAGMLQKPLNREPVLQALLLCGLYQLRAMRVAPHAAVGETVAAVDSLKKPWAKGLLNAILRRYQREREELEAALPDHAGVHLSYPDWMVEAIRRDWPQQWQEVLAAGNQQGPLTLRVNARRNSRERYAQELTEAGIAARPVEHAPNALRLEAAVGVDEIPGFAEGHASVQDASAQLAAALLAPVAGDRILDACAAPGGKTAHLLELADGIDVVALDSDAVRLQRVRDNLQRLGLAANFVTADAGKPSTWWDDKPFQHILLDAPCSGTGVIRRHPDIKWLRRVDDVPRMAAEQRRMLEALWPLLAPGGTLLYATCSILRAEGEDVVRDFLAARKDAAEEMINDYWGEACIIGRRIAPGADHDGFYYARLRKVGTD
jgi:16S rRNA (cytosine967-C5)-methyltransferase